jgi:hypothetical protein
LRARVGRRRVFEDAHRPAAGFPGRTGTVAAARRIGALDSD